LTQAALAPSPPAEGPAADVPRRKIAVALFALSALAYFLTAPGHLGTVDMRAEFSVAQSIVGKGDPTVSQSLPYVTVPSVVAANGNHYAAHGLGQSVLLLPAALVGRIAGCGDPASCSPSAQHLAEFTASFVDGLAAALAVTLLFLLALDLGAAVRPAVALSLLFGFTSIEWAYAHDAFDVGPTATVLLLAVFGLHRGMKWDSTRWLAIGGAAAGFAVLMRTPDVLCLPVLAAYLLVASWRLSRTAIVRRLVAFSVPIAAMLIIFAWYNWIRFGDPLQSGYTLASDYYGFGGSPVSGAAGFLFSPGRSIFLYSPILIAALVGVPVLWKRHRALTATMAALFAVNLVFYSFYPVWWGAWGWGPRYLVPMTPFLILPLLPLLQRWGDLPVGLRRAVCGLATAGVVLQLLDVAVDFQHQIQLQHEMGVDPDVQWWSPGLSAIWRDAGAMVGLLHGAAAYPVSYRFTDMALALPTSITFDVWWVHAWMNGVNPLVVITMLLGAVSGLVALALWLWRIVDAATLRRILPTRGNRPRPGAPEHPAPAHGTTR